MQCMFIIVMLIMSTLCLNIMRTTFTGCAINKSHRERTIQSKNIMRAGAIVAVFPVFGVIVVVSGTHTAALIGIRNNFYPCLYIPYSFFICTGQ